VSLKISISGIRGKFNDLTPERIVKFSEAFSTYIDGGNIAISRDTRPSGEFISEAISSGLLATKSNVYNFKILPSPILQWIIKKHKFKGGITITGGHNDFEWNSLIFLNKTGAYLNTLEGEEFFNIYHSNQFNRKKFDQLGELVKIKRDYVRDYFNNLSNNFNKGKKYRFVIDCSNGSISKFLPLLEKYLKIKVIPLFHKGSKSYKPPEPNISNAEILSTVVKETNCDGGLLFNSDASRILMVDEKGRIFSEELTLPAFVKMILEKQDSDVVTTYSTSRVVDEVVKSYNNKVYRTDVGQSSVVQKAIEQKAKIGGEGSGSVVFTPFSFAYDSIFFLKELIDYINRNKKTMSNLRDSFKEPKIYKEKLYFPMEQIYKKIEDIEKLYPRNKKLRDGFYIKDQDNWLCARVSSTENMIRVIGEGPQILEEIKRMKALLK